MEILGLDLVCLISTTVRFPDSIFSVCSGDRLVVSCMSLKWDVADGIDVVGGNWTGRRVQWVLSTVFAIVGES